MVNRYDQSYCSGDDGECTSKMEVAEDGDYVLATDYDSLSTRHARAIEALRGCNAANAKYIALLGKALDDSAWFLYVHGWKTPDEDVKAGEDCRAEIATQLAAVRAVLDEEEKG